MKRLRDGSMLALWVISLSCEGPQGMSGSGIESMSDPSVQPRVIYTYPLNNSTGPFPELYAYDCVWEGCSFYSQIQLRFNKFMEISSVRRAVRLSSPSGDIFADTSFILSFGGDVFTINPVDSNGYRHSFRFKVAETYTIRVDSTATDINGNRLRPAFSASFVPEPSFKVSQSLPADGDSGIGIVSSIWLTFNSEVDSSILSHLSTTPEIPVEWRIATYPTTVFTDQVSLRPWTTYTVSIGDSAVDSYGNVLAAPTTIRFRTTGFRVAYTSPPDGGIDILPTAVIEARFTAPISLGTVPGAFLIAPLTAGTYDNYRGSDWFRFRPTNGLKPATLYTVVLDSTINAIDGTPLPGPYSFTFSTAPFQVDHTSPADSVQAVSTAAYLEVGTNAYLSTSSLAGAVRIEPPAAISVSAYSHSTGFRIIPTSGLAPETWYTVTIDTSLRCLSGDALAVPHVFSFKTDFEPGQSEVRD